MHERIFAIALAALALLGIFELLRRQSIKEKYLVLWLATAVVIAAIAIHPALVDYAARAIGIKSGPNVVLVLGGLVITLVCVHVSIEISRLEDRSRALAEEVGLLRLELEKARAGTTDEG
jgi:hypothetical protein